MVEIKDPHEFQYVERVGGIVFQIITVRQALRDDRSKDGNHRKNDQEGDREL